MKKTIANLTKAFLWESQARNLYTFFAKVAKKEWYEEVSDIFLLTAENEREHAKWLVRMINQLDPTCSTKVELNTTPPKLSTSTIENLKTAIEGENYETKSMYPEFANIAKEEGLDDIAKRLSAIAIAEKHHRDRYIKLLSDIENNSVREKEEETYWVCKKCGYLHKGKKAPKICPSCSHPTKYFEAKCK